MTTKKEELREEWNKFVDTLPTRVGETPKEIIADFWLSKLDTCHTELAENIEELKKRLKMYLKYCKEQNGINCCKNCGLSQEDLQLIEKRG